MDEFQSPVQPAEADISVIADVFDEAAFKLQTHKCQWRVKGQVLTKKQKKGRKALCHGTNVIPLERNGLVGLVVCRAP